MVSSKLQFRAKRDSFGCQLWKREGGWERSLRCLPLKCRTFPYKGGGLDTERKSMSPRRRPSREGFGSEETPADERAPGGGDGAMFRFGTV